MECDRLALAAEIARIEPGEIIVSDALYGDPELAPWLRALPVTPLTRDVFDGATAERRLAAYFAVATTEVLRHVLAAGADRGRGLRHLCGAHAARQRPPLSPPTREAAGASLMIDAATRANLELMRTLSGERRGSLSDAIDRTVTVGGRAAARPAARGAAHRSGADRAPARCGRAVRRRCGGARGCARATRRGARSRALALAPRARPRRPARSRGDPRRARRPRRRWRAGSARSASCRRRSPLRRAHSRRRTPRSPRRSAPRSPTSCPT